MRQPRLEKGEQSVASVTPSCLKHASFLLTIIIIICLIIVIVVKLLLNYCHLYLLLLYEWCMWRNLNWGWCFPVNQQVMWLNHWADPQAVADAGAQSTSPHQVGSSCVSLVAGFLCPTFTLPHHHGLSLGRRVLRRVIIGRVIFFSQT